MLNNRVQIFWRDENDKVTMDIVGIASVNFGLNVYGRSVQSLLTDWHRLSATPENPSGVGVRNLGQRNLANSLTSNHSTMSRLTFEEAGRVVNWAGGLRSS